MSDEEKVDKLDLDKLGITEHWIDSIFSELDVMEVELDEDPLRYGPKRLAQKHAQVQVFLNQVSHIFLDVQKKMRILSRESNRMESTFELLKADLLANDPEVRAGRNIADRDALVRVKLRGLVEHRQKVEMLLDDLKAVDKVVKSSRIDLRAVQSRLKDQQKLCNDALQIGDSWGTALPPDATPVAFNPRSAMSVGSEDELDDLFKDTTGVHLDEEDWDKALDAAVEEVGADTPDPMSDDEEEEEDTDPTSADTTEAGEDKVKVEVTKPKKAQKAKVKDVEPEEDDPKAEEPVEAKKADGVVENALPEVTGGPDINDALAVEASQTDIDKFLEETDDLNGPPAPVQPDIDLDDLLAEL